MNLYYKFLMIFTIFLIIPLISATSWTEGLNEGLNYYYKFDDNLSSTNAIDEIGNENGTASTNTVNLASIDSKINTSFFVNGVDEYIDLTANLSGGGNTFTLSFWMKDNDSFSNEMVINRWGANPGSTVNHRTAIGFGNGNDNLYVYMGSNSTWNLINASIDTNWHHVVLNYNGTYAKVYFDNNLILDFATTFSEGYPDTWRIGTWSTTTASVYWGGYVDEIGLWNKSLSTSEIESLYNNSYGLKFNYTEETNEETSSSTNPFTIFALAGGGAIVSLLMMVGIIMMLIHNQIQFETFIKLFMIAVIGFFISGTILLLA